MLLKAQMSGLVTFLLASYLPASNYYHAKNMRQADFETNPDASSSGLLLQRNGSSIASLLDFEARYRPALQHNETIPSAGSYELEDDVRPCIKATMGVEYVVIENETNWYFNLDPSRVVINGKCDKEEALLSLMLPDKSAGLEFSFRKDKDNFYVTKLAARLSPLPVCKGCPNKTYSGVLSNKMLFKTSNDRSFKCESELRLSVSSELRIKLLPLQMQAFGVPNGRFGKADECWTDFNQRAIPIIIGSIALGLLLGVLLSFLIIRDRRRPGYERL